jgi:multisubunit Na+/H+ antiporter MnhB subunit
LTLTFLLQPHTRSLTDFTLWESEFIAAGNHVVSAALAETGMASEEVAVMIRDIVGSGQFSSNTTIHTF